MSSFNLTLSFRLTLPCAPQLLIYAETNGGKQKKKKKRYSIRNLANIVSCAAVWSWNNRLHNVAVLANKPYACHILKKKLLWNNWFEASENEKMCVFLLKTYFVIVNNPLSCFTSIKQFKKKIINENSTQFPLRQTQHGFSIQIAGGKSPRH